MADAAKHLDGSNKYTWIDSLMKATVLQGHANVSKVLKEISFDNLPVEKKWK